MDLYNYYSNMGNIIISGGIIIKSCYSRETRTEDHASEFTPVQI